LIGKKCGIVKESESLEQMTLQQYMNMYKEPLVDDSMNAILNLTEVAEEKEKKRSKNKTKDPTKEAEVDKMASKKHKKGKKQKKAHEGALP
jgi:hypothetical protein